MKYHTKYSYDTAENGPKLVEYLSKDNIVVDITGVPLDEDDQVRWAAAAADAEMVRLHSAMMAETHSLEKLADAGRAAAREHLDGQWVVGVHYTNEGEPHIHLAEFGTERALRMNTRDIDVFRRDLADRLGESIGTAPPSAPTGTITASIEKPTDADTGGGDAA